jgi:hypothetical protein
MLQLTDYKKLNKKEGPSEDASNPLRRRNKIIMGERGRETGWEREEEKGDRIRYGGRQVRSPEHQEK